MKRRMLTAAAAAVLLMVGQSGLAQEEKKEPKQEVKAANSESLKLSGRVQLQHLYSDEYDSDADTTNNGFRLRRVRVRTDAQLTPYVSGKIEFEVRDNSPRLKDAFGKILLFKNYGLRAGQYKVPVWREEFIRSSGELLLVERSSVARLLEESLLSARHVGIEFEGKPNKHFSFAVNYSNGAGEGIHEITSKKTVRVNNAKMLAGRIDLNLLEELKIGVSGAVNYLGNEIAIFDTADNKIGVADSKGENYTIAPDLGIYLPVGLDVEAGAAFGTLTKYFAGTPEDVNFTGFDITGRWKTKLSQASQSLGGMDALEIAAGVSFLDTDEDYFEEKMNLRFGPALYFGKKTRLQINGEYVEPSNDDADAIFRVRSQITVNL